MKLKDYAAALDGKAKLIKEGKGNEALTIMRYNGTKETAEWVAWMAYWTAIKASATLALVATRDRWTVPTLYPWEFDIDYIG